MLKIGLSNIYSTNLGDRIIYECFHHILEKCLAENGVTDYEIVDIYMSLRDMISAEEEKKLHWKALELNEKICKMPATKISVELLKRVWKNDSFHIAFDREQVQKLNDLDMMIFSGGGLIKFHKQFFHFLIDEITEICDRKKIPVIINAAGVEGFDSSDPNCHLLKEALNRKCVRYISTRDDLETLRNHYIKNKQIKTNLVCDPALWASECYGVEKKNNSGVIGLNAIRPSIWKGYLYEINHDILLGTYHELVLRLIQDGYRVEFFTNGFPADHKFFKAYCEKYEDTAKLMEKGLVTDYVPESPDDYVEHIAGYERFLAVRLHSAITGAALGVPNVSLVWNNKQILFGNIIGEPEYFITKDRFCFDEVYKLLMEAKPADISDQFRYSIYNDLKEQIAQFLKA